MEQERERIAKRLARAGLCSRREAEAWIAAGRVQVDGEVLTTPAVTVGPDSRIVVDGHPLKAREPVRLWRYHKPKGLVTTARDEKGRATVFDYLPSSLPRTVSVGRLDLNSEGLLLLTNDGELSRALELPATGWVRRYRVRAFGRCDEAVLQRLADGVRVDGERFGSIEAEVDGGQGGNVWLTVRLREGRNREVRRALEAVGLTVNRLIRVSYGPFQLGNLERGGVEEVQRRVLKEAVAHLLPESAFAVDPQRRRDRHAPKPGATPAWSPLDAGGSDAGDDDDRG